jgi:hypothetical protein
MVLGDGSKLADEVEAAASQFRTMTGSPSYSSLTSLGSSSSLDTLANGMPQGGAENSPTMLCCDVLLSHAVLCCYQMECLKVGCGRKQYIHAVLCCAVLICQNSTASPTDFLSAPQHSTGQHGTSGQ